MTVEQQEAAATVMKFFEISHRLYRDPEAPVQELADITTGTTQSVSLSAIADTRDAGLKDVGEVVTRLLSVGDLDNSGETPTVHVTACTDASSSDRVDQATGESAVGGKGGVVLLWHIDVVMDGNRWKVGDLVNEITDGCQ